MKGFIQRLALLIHWIGFGFFLLSVGFVIYGSYLQVMDDLFLASFLESIAAAGGLALFLWVLKWLISGNKSFFPWRS